MRLLLSVVRSVEHAGLVGRDHVLDVDERIFAAIDLEELEGLQDQVAQAGALPLGVLNLVPHVEVRRFEQVHDWQNLSVVGHKCLTDSGAATHKGLEHLESDADDFVVARVKRG